MSRDQEIFLALQYLLDEGFICLSLDEKNEPIVKLNTEVREAQQAIEGLLKNDKANWWKK